MKINLKNCPKSLKKKINFAVDFYSTRLIESTRIRNNCEITINFYRYNEKNKTAFVDIDDYNTKGQPRKFSIYLAKQSEEEILKILAHEMVHIKQYIAGEIDNFLESWKGEYFDRELSTYYNFPWEKEAYEKADILYNEWVKNGIKKIT